MMTVLFVFGGISLTWVGMDGTTLIQQENRTQILYFSCLLQASAWKISIQNHFKVVRGQLRNSNKDAERMQKKFGRPKISGRKRKSGGDDDNESQITRCNADLSQELEFVSYNRNKT